MVDKKLKTVPQLSCVTCCEKIVNDGVEQSDDI